jgi:hypothetical protein
MALTRLQWAAANRVLEVFENARLRPGMYFWPMEPESVTNWIIGIGCGFQAAQQARPEWYSLNVIRKYRLKTGARGLNGFIDQLRARGMAGEDIVDVLLAIQIETWQEWIDADSVPRKQSR